MSSEIEYKRLVFQETQEEWDPQKSLNPVTLAFCEQGSTNCYELNTNRRARSWRLLFLGPEYQLIEEVCTRAGITEGNGLRVGNNRTTTPERYIALWREAISKAYPMSDLLNKLPVHVVYLRIANNIPVLSSQEQDLYNRLKENWKLDTASNHGNMELTYSHQIEGLHTLLEWQKYRYCAFVLWGGVR